MSLPRFQPSGPFAVCACLDFSHPAINCACHADEGGALFKATEAREQEKELARLKAELAAAEHSAQQVSVRMHARMLACVGWKFALGT